MQKTTPQGKFSAYDLSDFMQKRENIKLQNPARSGSIGQIRFLGEPL
jgi:hypothetical protein